MVLLDHFFVELVTVGILLRFSETILNLANEEFAPAVEHVSSKSSVVTVLLIDHVFKLVRELECSLVSQQVALVLKLIDILLREDGCHFTHSIIGAPVGTMDFTLLLEEGVLGAAHNAEVRQRAF